MTTQDLRGTVALVTGASRGIGKGTALALGARGATVYVTARTTIARPDGPPGTITETAEAVTAAGGEGIALVCDHADDGQVAAVMERIRADHGHLDLLVNNVTALAPEIVQPPPFWTKPLSLADEIVVGLRSSYVATHQAAGLLIASERALVVNISFYGAVSYHLDPAYGATKAGTDKMTYDMAQDFAPHGVTVVSLWPGPTATEIAIALLTAMDVGQDVTESFETPVFTGRVIAALYTDDELPSRSGQVIIGAEAALAYGITDDDGRQPPVLRTALGSPIGYPG